MSLKRAVLLFAVVFPVSLCVISFGKIQRPGKKSIVSSLPNADDGNQKIVILYSNQRSGSTFMGEVFNHNGRAFYLYEPLFPYTPRCDILNRERIDLLEKMLRCDFSENLEAFRHAYSLTKFNDKYSACLNNSVCFTHRSEAILLRRRQSCENAMRRRECDSHLSHEALSETCASSKVVAFKILRVCSLKHIDELYQKFTEEGREMFVIHLLRDPRAVVSSRLSLLLRKEDAMEQTKLLCERITANIELVDDASATDALKVVKDNRYLRIRYEEAATRPIEAASTIYRFLGLTLPEEVMDWVKTSTLQSQQTLTNLENQLSDSGNLQENPALSSRYKHLVNLFRSPYDTVKDPKRTVQKWRNVMPLEMVMDIQKVCKNAMKRLNYHLVENTGDLRDLDFQLWY